MHNATSLCFRVPAVDLVTGIKEAFTSPFLAPSHTVKSFFSRAAEWPLRPDSALSGLLPDAT